jgi:hypothetical protein
MQGAAATVHTPLSVKAGHIYQLDCVNKVCCHSSQPAHEQCQACKVKQYGAAAERSGHDRIKQPSQLLT